MTPQPSAPASSAPSFWRTWLLWFLLVSIGMGVLLGPMLWWLDKQRVALIATKESRILDNAESRVHAALHERMDDANMLSRIPAVTRYAIGKAPDEKSIATSVFESFCNSYGNYDQIRLLDAQGQELVRVNHASQGPCTVTPETELQDKGERYYFKAALNLAPGEVYISPLDLNVEHGQIEVPNKPVIRFSTPVRDSQGQVRGVLVLNYLANDLLTVLYPKDNRQLPISFYVLNPNGYYLKNTDAPQREFGFMWKRPADRFEHDHPPAWKALGSGALSLQSADALYLFRTVTLTTKHASAQLKDARLVDNTEREWFLVLRLADRLLTADSLLLGPYRVYWYTLLFLMAIGLSGLIARYRLNQNELEDAHRKFEALFDLAPDPVLVSDARGRIEMANRQAHAVFDFEPSGLPGHTLEELIPELFRDQPGGLPNDFAASLDRRTPADNFEVQGIKRNGTEFPALLSLAVSKIGGTRHVITSLRDITALKSNEARLHRLHKLIEEASDCFYLVDLDDNIRMTMVNAATEQHFGVPRETLCTWHIWDWDTNFTADKVPELIQRLKRLPHQVIESQHRTAGGRLVPVEVSVNHFVDEHGRSYCYGWFHDQSQQLTIRRQQEDARLAAEAASRAKSNFLATMSHEIRTPLNAIMGTAHLLQHGTLTPTQRRDVQVLSTATKGLQALISDILDFSKIEAGELDLDPVAFSLPMLLQDLYTLFQGQANAKGIDCLVDALPANLPPYLVGDELRLRQCLLNLLSNALKFTREGHIRLGVSTPPNDGDNLRLRFTVEDTGIGMTADQMANLFQPFVQADSSTTRHFGGTGLGLSIVKRLAEMMGGQVGVESAPNVGSRFWIDLPFQVADALLDQRPQDAFQPLAVLVADDNPADRQHFTQMAQLFGWSVETVPNGQAAVQRVIERLQTHRPIECLILDWLMPTMDGVTALKSLAQQLPLEAMPTVIMASVADREALQSELSELAPDHILTKPVQPSTLFNAVNEAMAIKGHDMTRALSGSRIAGTHSQWLSNTHIVVVDDSTLNLEVMRRILEEEGATASLCDSGEAALQYLQAFPNVPDLVLMDMQMPGLDGVVTTEKIRTELQLPRLPVVALTAGVTATEHDRAMQAGMQAFLSKPVDPSQLIRTIRRLVEGYRNTPVPLAIREAPTATISTQPNASTWPEIAGVDIPGVQRRLSNDWPLFLQQLNHLLNDYADLEHPPQVPTDEVTAKALRAQMHRLAGNAGTLGVTALHRNAKAAENQVVDQAWTALPSTLEQVSASYRALAAAARHVLAAQSAAAPQVTPMEDPQALHQWGAELAQRRFSAQLGYPALRATLEQTLSADAFAALDAAMGRLDFGAALAVLTQAGVLPGDR